MKKNGILWGPIWMQLHTFYDKNNEVLRHLMDTKKKLCWPIRRGWKSLKGGHDCSRSTWPSPNITQRIWNAPTSYSLTAQKSSQMHIKSNALLQFIFLYPNIVHQSHRLYWSHSQSIQLNFVPVDSRASSQKRNALIASQQIVRCNYLWQTLTIINSALVTCDQSRDNAWLHSARELNQTCKGSNQVSRSNIVSRM